MSDSKKFGLVMPKKAETLKMRKNSVFNDDSDDEIDHKKNARPKIPQKKMQAKAELKTETLDPSIYEYDSIYDDMKAKQKEGIAPKEKKNSRYIETLLKAADKKKKEYERRIDRKIQVEREKEGDKFKDKEAFVTTSYKKKMEEKEEEDERERRKNMLNDMMDVTKQKDLSGFYRHFLNQTVGEEKIPLFGEKLIKKEVESDQDDSSNKVIVKIKLDENIDEDSDGVEIDDNYADEKSDQENANKKTPRKRTSRYKDQRHKRMKHSSDNKKSKDNEYINTVKIHLKKYEGSSESDANMTEDEPSEIAEKRSCSDNRKDEKKTDDMHKHNPRHDTSSSEDESSNKSANGDQQSASKDEKQSKINIYAKRTIGDTFAEAQARYFQRMSIRNSSI